MAGNYEDAVAELFLAPHANFVTERKRLSAELKAAGDKTGAATLGKLGRPPLSAWAVNQLWRKAPAEFEILFETAQRIRAGDLGATTEHREALATLRSRAASILAEAGNAANEATLRRVVTTLSALAARGGFAPDLPGALCDDRDPPGFEAAGIPSVVVPPPAPSAPRPGVPLAAANDDAERKAAEEEKEKALAERKRREAELEAARGEVERLTGQLGELQREVLRVEGQLVKARALVVKLEEQR
jgi:hypothetical protein